MVTGAVSKRKRNSSADMPEKQQRLSRIVDDEFAGILSRDDDGAWEYNLTYRLVSPSHETTNGQERNTSPIISQDTSQEALFLSVCKQLKVDPRLDFNMLIDVTAVDWLDSRIPRFDVVYQFLSLNHCHRITLKLGVEEDVSEVPSIRQLWPAANFLEREVWDMFGIRFAGHGDLRRILLYDEFQGHPLRKDYPIHKKQPRIPLRYPELPNSSAYMRREELVKLPLKKKVGQEEQK